MRVMCLNGWGGKLHDLLVPYLRTADPDLLCLQEVVHTPATTEPWLTYRDDGMDLPQRANFFRDVSDALPGHIAVFCPAAQGDLWDGHVAVPSQWGLATFVRASIPVIGQAQGFVHKAFSPDGYGDHPRSRTGHVVRVHDFATGHPVTIAQMHGLRDLQGKTDTPDRQMQADRFLQMIETVVQKGDRLIVCGDFNVLPDSAIFDRMRRIGLTDLVTGRGFTDTRTSHYTKPGRYADYMLVNDLVQVQRFDVVEQPEVSDHRPLLIEFR